MDKNSNNKTLRLLLDELPKGDSVTGYVDRQLLESFYFDCRVRNLSQHTIHDYAVRLRYLLRWCKLNDLKIKTLNDTQIKNFIHSLIAEDRLSPSTINGLIRVFKCFYKYLHNENLLQSNPTERLKLIKEDIKIKPVLNDNQIKQLLSHWQQLDFCSVRNKVMSMFLLDTAVRVGELLNLKISDIQFDTQTAIVNGKSRRERYVPMSTKTIKELHKYIFIYRQGIVSENVFCYEDGRPMTVCYTSRLFNRVGKKLGFELYPHLLRHTGATKMLAKGMSGLVLQRILGHTTPVITSRYIHLDKADMVNQHNQFTPLG